MITLCKNFPGLQGSWFFSFLWGKDVATSLLTVEKTHYFRYAGVNSGKSISLLCSC